MRSKENEENNSGREGSETMAKRICLEYSKTRSPGDLISKMGIVET